MKYLVYVAVLAAAAIGLQTNALGQSQAPEVELTNNKLTVRADAISLSRLLQMLDQSTGMTSKVPPELVNRNISVQFSDLDLDQGIRKIFEGQRLDYIYIGGRGIFVTSVSQARAAQEQPPAFPSQPVVPPDSPFNQNQLNSTQNDVFVPGGQVPPQPVQQQPAMIQTPFGPIPNPQANQALQPGASVPLPPGQQVPTTGPQGPLGGPGVFGAPSALSPTPLGDSNSLGNPQAPAGSPLNPGGFPGLTPSRP